MDHISIKYLSMNGKAVVLAILVALVASQKCDMALDDRVDCGFMGIDQPQCEAKSCCWKPARLLTQAEEQKNGGVPWCFFQGGQSPCSNISFAWTDGPGFDSAFYDQMYTLFDKNINIQGKGGVVASPDPSTPGGSYFFHWMRDAGLVMRTVQEINNFDLSKFDEKLKAYVGWVKRVQGETDPQGFDVRINPKFELPNGEVYVGGWCRPQTDGPGLRSAALMTFANVLLNNSQKSYVTDTLVDPIKKDLDWVLENWKSDGCDLWEEVRSNDFFWGRAAFVYAFDLCDKLFTTLGDSSYASKCSSAKSAVQATLDGHWTGSFMTESANRQKDGSVVHAFSSFNVYPITDEKVAKTMKVLATTFCSEYQINQQDIKAGVPGILIGRYPGDSYAGGNPWQLLTAVYAKTFYQGANALMEQNGFLKEEDKNAWFDLLSLHSSADINEQIQAAKNAGDAVMYRLYKYVKNDGGHIAEQIGKTSGAQLSAKDLTWSFANILSAMREREKVTENFSKFKQAKTQ